MKKTYFSPVTRYIDLAPEVGCLGTLSQLPELGGDNGYIDNEGDVLTKNHSIWDNWSDDNL